jgi:flagellar assembly factor FliW
MTIETLRFGPVEVPEDRILLFPHGIMPFGAPHWFALIQRPSEAPFAWLQSVDEPSLAFLVAGSSLFFPDYRPRCSPADAEALQLAAGDAPTVLLILTVDAQRGTITANLLGPILVNFRTQRAVQVILSDDRLSTRHPLPALLDCPLLAAET